MVVLLILGVVYVEDVPNELPPDDKAYHVTVPDGFEGIVADNVTEPAPHLAAPTADGAAGVGFMFTITLYIFSIVSSLILNLWRLIIFYLN